MNETFWMEDVPPEVRATAEPLIEKWAHLRPSWCHLLKIAWNDAQDDASMSTEAHCEYRMATITIFPAWLSARDREGDIKHEMIHLPLWPMTQFVSDLSERLTDEVLREWVFDQWRQRFEGAVEDLRLAIK